MKPKASCIILLTISCLTLTGCFSIKLSSDKSDPLREYTVQGTGSQKILLLPVSGNLSTDPKEDLLATKPGIVEEVVSQLRKAEKDGDIKAVLMKIDSPGGSVTASDMLYHEILAFKRKTGAKIVAIMMDVAASGGYYISLPADHIMAHPTTITGSVGVIFMRPRMDGLLEKIGAGVDVTKSGKNKDMASPFRESTGEEEEIFRGLIKDLAARFLDLVSIHRRIGKDALREISTGRIYLAGEALRLGLVDEIGYLTDAVSKTKTLAGLPKNAKIVVYRRDKHANDNLYNSAVAGYGGHRLSAGSKIDEALGVFNAGFYYLWPGAVFR